jgi:protein-serine/threonine kinase
MSKGYPPFCSENAHDVYRKIIDWRSHLFFPDDVHLSREAEDLIKRMLCEADRRLTVEQLKSHPVRLDFLVVTCVKKVMRA